MDFLSPVILETAAEAGSVQSSMTAMLITFVPILVVFYFFIIRPQKKREKEEKEIRDSLAIGDEVITIGGIIGIVVRLADDTLVIETGGDRSKIRIQRSAIRENVTASERKQAENAAAKAEKMSSLTSAASVDVQDKKDKKSKKDSEE